MIHRGEPWGNVCSAIHIVADDGGAYHRPMTTQRTHAVAGKTWIPLDGKPLADAEWPYVLRSIGDQRPGPGHVTWLRQIDVIRIGA